ncbi:MAG: NifU family protein [Patescibacteria group bacterium]
MFVIKKAKKSLAAKAGSKTALLARIEKCVDEQIRPLLAIHGGEIEIVEFTKNILRVKLQGACAGCPAAGNTLQYGVQAILNEEIPDEDIQVVPVQEESCR